MTTQVTVNVSITETGHFESTHFLASPPEAEGEPQAPTPVVSRIVRMGSSSIGPGLSVRIPVAASG